MQKKDIHEEDKDGVDIDDIVLISKEQYLASQFDKGQRIHFAGAAAAPRGRQPGGSSEIDVIKSLQRDSSLDKLHTEKNLDDLSN